MIYLKKFIVIIIVVGALLLGALQILPILLFQIPLPIKIIILIIGIAIAISLVYVMMERLRELKEENEDDYSKY